MCQVSCSYSLLLLRCHCLRVMHFISCHHAHCICIRVRLLHPSIFPVVRFAIRRSHLLTCTPLVFFRERVSNVLGMDRGLSSGLGIPPVKFRSIWRSFGTPTVNRASAKSFCVLQQNPLQTAQNPSKSPPCSRSFDHDRVGESRTPFGAS